MNFYASDILQITGVKRNRLQAWLEKGYIKPSIPADGHGTRNIYTLHDVYAIAIFKQLIERGLRRDEAAQFIGEFTHSVKIYFSPEDIDNCLQGLYLADYVLFKRTAAGIVESIAFGNTYKPIRIDLQTGMADNSLVNGEADWDDILIVNVKKLRRQVGNRVEKLFDVEVAKLEQ